MDMGDQRPKLSSGCGSVTLDTIFRLIGGRCKLLKMDVEGSEYNILYRASIETLTRIDYFTAEYHDIPGLGADCDEGTLRAYLAGRVKVVL